MSGPDPLLVDVAGEQVSLWADRAISWRDALFVADLHLGKSAAFRSAGLPLPPGELDHDLARLRRLVERSQARRLVVLGDLVHGPLTTNVVDAVAAWRATVDVEWRVVRGNHDRHAPVWPSMWRLLEHAPLHRDGPFALVHEPALVAGATALAGHVHPSVTISNAGQRLRFPTFVLEPGLILLPAFTQFSGGPSMRREAGRRRYACAESRVIALDD